MTALADRGYRVRAVARSRSRAEAPGQFGAPALAGTVAQWAVGEITCDGFASGLTEGVDHVVSALGVTRQKADPWDVDFMSNLRVLDDAERHGVGSFLYVNVMHARDGRSMIMRAKTAFATALTRSAVAAQIVNPSGYFSDVTDFLMMARRGVAVLPPDPTVRIAPIHGADLADFCVDRLAGGESGAWDVGGPEVMTYHGVAELAFAAVGRRPHYVTIPRGAVASGLWVASRLGRRTADLAQFFADGLAHEDTGQRCGTRRLADYFRAIESGRAGRR